MTKIKCERCERFIDLNIAYIVLIHAGMVGTSIYAYCKKCINEKTRENKRKYFGYKL